MAPLKNTISIHERSWNPGISPVLGPVGVVADDFVAVGVGGREFRGQRTFGRFRCRVPAGREQVAASRRNVSETGFW